MNSDTLSLLTAKLLALEKRLIALEQRESRGQTLRAPEHNIRLLLPDSAGNTYVSVVASNLNTVASISSSGNIATVGNYTAAGDAFLRNSGQGIYSRLVNYGFAPEYHFHGGGAPSGYSWVGSPFNGFPAFVEYSYFGEYMYVHCDANKTHFFARSVPSNFWSYRMVYRGHIWYESSLGVRTDDGTDNNYIEGFWLYAGNLKKDFRMIQRTNGNAPVVTTVRVQDMLTESRVVRNGYEDLGGGFWRFHFALAYETINTTNITESNAVNWTPTRIGLLFNRAAFGTYAFVDWMLFRDYNG